MFCLNFQQFSEMVFIYVQNMWSVFLHILKRYIFAGLQVRNAIFANPIAKCKTHLKSKACYLLFIYLGLKKNVDLVSYPL